MVIKLTVIFDLWLWKPLQQCPLTWRNFSAKFHRNPSSK